MKTYNSVIVVAIVAIVASLTLSQAQAGFTEDFESGFTSGSPLNGQGGWVPGASQFASNPDNIIVQSGRGRGGGMGVWKESSGALAGGPSKAHGEDSSEGSSLTAIFDFLPGGEEVYVGFLRSTGGGYVGARLVQSGSTWQNFNGPGPVAAEGAATFITAGQWHRGTLTHVIGGAASETSIELYNYDTGQSVTYTPAEALGALNLDMFTLHSTDGGTTQFDNISVSGVAVPEPTSAVLLSLGLVTMLGCGRRNRR